MLDEQGRNQASHEPVDGHGQDARMPLAQLAQQNEALRAENLQLLDMVADLEAALQSYPIVPRMFFSAESNGQASVDESVSSADDGGVCGQVSGMIPLVPELAPVSVPPVHGFDLHSSNENADDQVVPQLVGPSI
jgi:hypothetical protein